MQTSPAPILTEVVVRGGIYNKSGFVCLGEMTVYEPWIWPEELLNATLSGAAAALASLFLFIGRSYEECSASRRVATSIGVFFLVVTLWMIGLLPFPGSGTGNNGSVGYVVTALSVLVAIVIGIAFKQLETQRGREERLNERLRHMEADHLRIQRAAELTNQLVLSDDTSRDQIVLPYVRRLYMSPPSVRGAEDLALSVFITRPVLRGWLTTEDWRHIRHLASGFEHDIASVRDEVRAQASNLYQLKPD